MDYNLSDYEAYLWEHYKNSSVDSSLFMKLVEEVGEVTEILNMRNGRKACNGKNLKNQLAGELADVIHYAIAIAALNQIDISSAILEKDKAASVKYHHNTNLSDFITDRNN